MLSRLLKNLGGKLSRKKPQHLTGRADDQLTRPARTAALLSPLVLPQSGGLQALGTALQRRTNPPQERDVGGNTRTCPRASSADESRSVSIFLLRPSFPENNALELQCSIK